MPQYPFLRALDEHNQPAMWVGAGDACIRAHPVIRVGGALLGGQQGHGGLHGIQAKWLTGRQMHFAPFHLEIIADLVLARAIAVDLLNADLEVIKFKFIHYLY